MHDTVILGGGPAGAAAAIHLARRGRPALVLERSAEARHVICGEFISGDACASLRHLGIDLPALGAVPIDSLRLTCGESLADISLPFSAMSLSRKTLDEALVQQAIDAGATVRRGVTVTGLECIDGIWHVRTSDGDLSARRAVLASGKYGLRGWPRRTMGTDSDMIGFKIHLRVPSSLPNAVELHLFSGGYAGLEPVEHGLANLCLIVTKEHFRQCDGQWPTLLEALKHAAPHLGIRLRGAEACWDKPLSISAVPYGYLHKQGIAPEPYRVGDQLAVIPSLFGDGLAIALHTGEQAARAIARDHSTSTYHTDMYRLLHRQIGIASTLSRVAKTRAGMHAILLAGRYLPGLIRSAANLTRIDHLNTE